MRGTVEPLPLRYSAGLRQLIASMLALNPADRPDLVTNISIVKKLVFIQTLIDNKAQG